MVFQSYALYPHMTCYENLSLNLRLAKTPKLEIDQRVKQTARLLEIEELLNKKPGSLSGGQRQRVAVGRALIRNPRAFLFDEPLSSLDAILRERVRHELKELFKKLRATVVYVTHDQTEALTLADRVVVMNRGKVQQMGTPEELYRQPANCFVAGFIGSPAMNIFEATLTKGRFALGLGTIKTQCDWSGPVFIGIRPECLKLGEPGIPATVSWVENLGRQYLIGVRVAHVSLTLMAADRPAGTSVALELAPEEIHVFDQNTEENLACRHGQPAARL
jgi:ABC-type sugar transport system ATPase subunit